MNRSVSELYQNVILEHNREPRNFRRLDGSTGKGEGTNPLCGDEVTVYVKVDGGIVRDVSFQGSGCAISRASASLMTQVVKGKPVAEARRLFDEFHAWMVGIEEPSDSAAHSLGKLAALGGVRAFPMRVKCATLAWHALNAALATP